MGNQRSRACDNNEQDTATYTIVFKTNAEFVGSGTDSTVSIELFGEDGAVSTGSVKLDQEFYDNFEPGRLDTFTTELKDVGLPLIVRIKLKHDTDAKDSLLCDFIKVSVNDQEATFPVCDWIYDEIEVTRGEAILPQKVKNIHLSSMIERELKKADAKFSWIPRPTENDIGWGFPRYVNAVTYKDLPDVFQRTKIRQLAQTTNKLESGIHLMLKQLESTACPLENLESFHYLYEREAVEVANDRSYISDWDTDEGMGRQVLNGISPLVLQKCSKLPNNLNVTNSDVLSSLAPGTTLETNMAAGKIYISDYSEMLEGAIRNIDPATKLPLHCANSIALFYSKPNEKFVPIAIQLVPGDRNYLFTPSSAEHDWLLAKMYYRCSQANAHEWLFHYSNTHSVSGTGGTALYKYFPKCHPVFKLLQPHLRTVEAINTDARATLLPEGSSTNKSMAISATSLARKAYKTFHHNDIVIPKLLKKQGTDDPELLPGYYYRDDAIAHWKIMEKYIRSVLSFYYKSGEDIISDFCLQTWAQGSVTEGIAWQDNNPRGFKSHILSLDELVEACTTIMFTSSVQHAAVNFGQFETYKYIPNSPFSMRLPPHKVGEGSMARIMNSLPDNGISNRSIAVSYTLSQYAPNEVYLGEFPDRLFVETEIEEIQEEYRKDLQELGKKIEKRNKDLQHKYTYLHPKNIPNSIAI
uniref:arachidonate 5-lipoxygenase-like n=1 Tax=Ciona intestinalis TaxID=7719 RepID=UPI000180B88B|nr:arachidonate 5-lipoxygenase-like [Ciona intestinalis]|eukprot:XP_002123695.1 arachidonate 5-lipoxygenase-like [Ciona intestinalis]